MPQALLEGRTAVITGAAQGIGLAIAQMFVAEGAQAVLGDLDGAAAAKAAETLGGPGVAVGVRCDVTDATEVDQLLAVAAESFSPVDVMVNNAGILRDATMRTMTEEQLNTVIDVHLKGTWNGTRKAAAVMREHKRGAIINLSSIAGKVGNPGQTNYAAAKAGIVGLTKAAAKEMAHHGVRVNAIQPGLIRTAMTEVSRSTSGTRRSPTSPWAGSAKPPRSHPWSSSWPPTCPPT